MPLELDQRVLTIHRKYIKHIAARLLVLEGSGFDCLEYDERKRLIVDEFCWNQHQNGLEHFCTAQNEIYILYICRECWDILRDASSRWHCLMYLLSANKKTSSACSANQRPGWGHYCHDLTPVMGWEQEVTRGRSKNVFIAKIVLKDDYYCILSPTPHLF